MSHVFDHPCAQRAYIKTLFSEAGEERVLVLEYDFGLSFDYLTIPGGADFEALVAHAKEVLADFSEIDRVELTPSASALARAG